MKHATLALVFAAGALAAPAADDNTNNGAKRTATTANLPGLSSVGGLAGLENVFNQAQDMTNTITTMLNGVTTTDQLEQVLPDLERELDALNTTVAPLSDAVMMAGAVNPLAGLLNGITSGLGTTLSGLANGLGSTINGVTSGLGNTLGSLTAGVGALGSIVGGLTVPALPTPTISPLIPLLGGITSGLGTTLGSLTSELGNGLQQGLTTGLSSLDALPGISGVIFLVVQFLGAILNLVNSISGISPLLSALASGPEKLINDLLSGILSAVGGILPIAGLVGNLPNGAIPSSILSNALGSIGL